MSLANVVAVGTADAQPRARRRPPTAQPALHGHASGRRRCCGARTRPRRSGHRATRARPVPRDDLPDAPGHLGVRVGAVVRGPPVLGGSMPPSAGRGRRRARRARTALAPRRARRQQVVVRRGGRGRCSLLRVARRRPLDRRQRRRAADHDRGCPRRCSLQRPGARDRALAADGARVGTVDKFQGQEAAIAIVSMATSSAADAPRGLEFLLSTNRLNVAVSRARALAIVVASPTLLTTECRSLPQIQLVNGLCRYVELVPGCPPPG